jgi:hypothetical protein
VCTHILEAESGQSADFAGHRASVAVSHRSEIRCWVAECRLLSSSPSLGVGEPCPQAQVDVGPMSRRCRTWGRALWWLVAWECSREEGESQGLGSHTGPRGNPAQCSVAKGPPGGRATLGQPGLTQRVLRSGSPAHCTYTPVTNCPNWDHQSRRSQWSTVLIRT